MKTYCDLHTHTISSGHAYSTLLENVVSAKAAGLKILGVSDHAPTMPGSTQAFHFNNLRVIPDYIEGIRILKGVEANILNDSGDLDMGEKTLQKLDYCIASLHLPCYIGSGEQANTQACIKAIQNPYVTILGHPDDDRIPIDLERVLEACKKYQVLPEVNNSSLSTNSFRQNAYENVKKMLTICKKFEIPIILGSDSHFATNIGDFDNCIKVIKEMDFPDSLIVNLESNGLASYITNLHCDSF